MIKLFVDDAVSLVRKNMDEVDIGTEGMLQEPNTTALDEVIRRTLPEAVNAVNRMVPVNMLQGVDVRSVYEDDSVEPSEYKSDYKEITINSDGTVDVTLDKDNLGPWLRMVSLMAIDSKVVLAEVTAEASAEGRKQLNPYVRGRHDNPVMVQLQSERLKFTYYSLKEESIDTGGELHDFDLDTYVAAGGETSDDPPEPMPFPFKRFSFMPECELEKGRLYVEEDAQEQIGAHYLISDGLLDAVINQLTGMVLTVYGLTEKSKIFFDNISYTE